MNGVNGVNGVDGVDGVDDGSVPSTVVLPPAATAAPVGALIWTSWTGRAYSYRPPALQDEPGQPAGRAAAAAHDHGLHEEHEAVTDANGDDVTLREAWYRSRQRLAQRAAPAFGNDSRVATLVAYPDEPPF